jgi:4-hydroxy-tetrahydrodipicolinate synthase
MITGSMVALVTPMCADGRIHWDQLAKLVEYHVAAGTAAIVAVGTTGESATLSVEEHAEVIRFTVQQARRRVPVIAGTGANSTTEAIELTALARDAGADAALLVTPYYNKPTQEGLYQHYMAIARAVDLPQILYNVPGRTACDLLPETVIRLADHPNIVGIKEATGSLDRARRILGSVPDGFALYSGDDATAMELMRLGAKGNISVTANLTPDLMQGLCQAVFARDYDRAAILNNKMGGLNYALFLEANPIPVKWAMHRLGLIDSGIRLPLTTLSPQHHGLVESAMHRAGLLS